MNILDNKCPGCGAPIKFNPNNQLWDCEYCGQKYSLEEMQKYVNASSDIANTQVKKEEMDIYHCNNCGAEIVADKNTTATFCLYCGSSAILKNRIDNYQIPDYIIPFKKEKNDAVMAFKQLMKGKPLAPPLFKRKENIKKITGIYIPFWAYDVQAEGNAIFNAKDIRHYSDSEYDYTETKTYLITNNGFFEYDKVIADASTRFANDLMDSLEPFDYKELVPYNHAYLAGYFSEKYDVSKEDNKKRIEERVNNTSIQLLKEKVRHEIVTLQDNNLKIKYEKIYYVLLPVWMVNIKFKNKMYTFAMNGQTGELIGNIPIDIFRVIIYTIISLISWFVVAFLAVLFMGV